MSSFSSTPKQEPSFKEPQQNQGFGGYQFEEPKKEPGFNQGFDISGFGSTPKQESLGNQGFNGGNFGSIPKQEGGFNKGFNFTKDTSRRISDDFNEDDRPQDLSGNKDIITNMYNKTGVNDLAYSPYQTRPENQGPITHERSSENVYNQVPDFAKQVVAFYSTKGGVGKTSLAINATIQLAKYSKKKICIIDFDTTSANVHTHLGILDATYDLGVISNFQSEIDGLSLSKIVTPYRVKDKNGETVEFDVIVGFKEMNMSQRFTEKEVFKILSILEDMYDIVIVDTHPVYTDLVISTILKKATKIIFVAEQEMPALNGAKDFALASKKYGIPSEKLFLVLNRYKTQTTVFTKNRIEKVLNKTVLATIPSDMDSLRDAVNTNLPVTISNPDSELARAYIDVAKIMDTNLVVPPDNRGFFKRFKR